MNFLIIIFILTIVNIKSNVLAIEMSISQRIAIKQIKSCELDPDCFGCWKTVDKSLADSMDNLNCRWPTPVTSSVPLKLFGSKQTILKSEKEKQYCCSLWGAFDCRSERASRQCTLFGFIKYRRHMVIWANDLMRQQVCTDDSDYRNKNCQQILQKDTILDEFDFFSKIL